MRTRSSPWRNAAQSNIPTGIASASLGMSCRQQPSLSKGWRPAGTDRTRDRGQAGSVAPPIDTLPGFQTSDNSPIERTYLWLQRGGGVAFQYRPHDDGRIRS